MTPAQAIGHITTNRYLIILALARDGKREYRYSRIHELVGDCTSLYKDLTALEGIGILSAEPPFGQRGRGTKVIYRFDHDAALELFEQLAYPLTEPRGAAH